MARLYSTQVYSTLGNSRQTSDFYKEALGQADQYGRLAGYFRASAYEIVKAEIVSLADRAVAERRCGILLACSPPSGADREALIAGGLDAEALKQLAENKPETVQAARSYFAKQFELMKSETTTEMLVLLKTLVASGAMQVLLVAPTAKGIMRFHDKVGVVWEGKDVKWTFIGSSNEGWMGLNQYGNHESIVAFDAADPSDESGIRELGDYFTAVWSDGTSGDRAGGRYRAFNATELIDSELRVDALQSATSAYKDLLESLPETVLDEIGPPPGVPPPGDDGVIFL